MGHYGDRREFLKTLGSAVVAPCMLRAVGAAGLGISSAFAMPSDPLVLGVEPLPNRPVGVAKGLHPGRVVWARDAAATSWAGLGQGHWWESDHTSQKAVDSMMSQAIQALGGKGQDAKAWDAIFKYFNHAHGNGKSGYRKGEKLTIKVNLVGCLAAFGGVDPKTYDLAHDLDYMNASPQMILALLRQLVHEAGVREQDISVGDPLALFPNQFYGPLHAEFPNVSYLDHDGGNATYPRTRVQFSSIPFYWSSRLTGVAQDHVPLHYAEAKYLINMASLKAHTGAGVTLCAKNHFGSLIRRPPDKGYYEMHTSLPMLVHGNGQYRNLVDLMGHAQIGGKTLLCLMDGLYPGVHPIEHAPRKFLTAPFNGHWASSLLASQDPVAIDSVGLDFLRAEWNDYPHMAGVDDYLHEAALADRPPSVTFYDPDHASRTTRLQSLGVHEHWNNPREKQYSRNLGGREGIELVRVGQAG